MYSSAEQTRSVQRAFRPSIPGRAASRLRDSARARSPCPSLGRKTAWRHCLRLADDLGLQQQRQHAGADEGGLAAAAHADDQHEGLAGLPLPPQLQQHVGDRGGAPEEHGGVLGFERRQATERRAPCASWPRRPRRSPAGRCGWIEPAQMRFEQVLEIGRRLEAVEGGLERALRRC